MSIQDMEKHELVLRVLRDLLDNGWFLHKLELYQGKVSDIN